MSGEIRFRIGRFYKEEGAAAIEKDIAERVARIIDWQGLLIEKDHGYRWNIGSSNDWWMDKGDHPDEFKVVHRYLSDADLGWVRVAIIRALRLEQFNDLPEVNPADQVKALMSVIGRMFSLAQANITNIQIMGFIRSWLETAQMINQAKTNEELGQITKDIK